MGLVGKEAILAWRVADGVWNDVDLTGLAVVAVVSSPETLGDVAEQPDLAGTTRAALLVDARASAAEEAALVDLARTMGGVLVEEVTSIDRAPIELTVEDATRGVARLAAGDLAEIRTRALTQHDRHCGNEIVFYDPLAPTVTAVPAATLIHRYDGGGLGKSWSSPDKRSAFVGTFGR